MIFFNWWDCMQGWTYNTKAACRKLLPSFPTSIKSFHSNCRSSVYLSVVLWTMQQRSLAWVLLLWKRNVAHLVSKDGHIARFESIETVNHSRQNWNSFTEYWSGFISKKSTNGSSFVLQKINQKIIDLFLSPLEELITKYCDWEKT